jgi:two-component system OmpR family sensor kinase
MHDFLNILLIEDNDEHAQIISRHIRDAERSRVRVVREARLQDGLKRLREGGFGAVLLDLRLPDSDADTTLARTIQASPAMPIVVLSSLEDREVALKAVHEGAQDYLFKTNLSSELLVRAIFSAIERKHVEARIREQANFTRALYDLGQQAIMGGKIENLMARVVNSVRESLGVEFTKILELQPDHKSFLLKAGTGWKRGCIGHVHVPADLTSQAGYTLRAGRPVVEGDLKSHEPIIVTDLPHENRFLGRGLLNEHGVASGMSVIIYGKDESHPYGVLGAHTAKPRIFSQDEASFLQAVANTFAAAFSRRQLEEELKQKIQELNVAHRRKDEFLATLSHELRTPLNVIIGNLQVLRESNCGAQEFTDALAAIERSANDEVQLVADTLEMSRIITGKMNLSMAPIDFCDVLDGALDSVKFAAAAKKIRIEKKLKLDDKRIYGDGPRLRQVAWNLLSNAAKFTPEGGRITIDATISDSELRLIVSDTGKGISPENLPHVFERFWQEDSAINRKFMGLGLGLAIVKHVVEMHGGTVIAESPGLGLGATFTVTLPLNAATVAEPATIKEVGFPISPLVGQGASAATLKNRRLLLIDDSLDSLSLLAKLLEKKGAEVHAVHDPFVALEEAKRGDYDLVISDIGMPEMSGYDLMRSLRKWEDETHHQHLPAIALTAYVTSADAERALASGFQRHFPKPINFLALSEAVSDLITAH